MTYIQSFIHLGVFLVVELCCLMYINFECDFLKNMFFTLLFIFNFNCYQKINQVCRQTPPFPIIKFEKKSPKKSFTKY